MSVFAWGPAAADPVSADPEDVPATPAQRRFVERIVEQVKAAVPPLAGWHRRVSATASGNPVLEGRPVMIFHRAVNVPLRVNLQLVFERVTEAERETAATRKSAEQLQQELVAAAMQGDVQRMEALQRELQALMQGHMTKGPMGQAAGLSPPRPVEKPPRFTVTVVVNGEGAVFGKTYEIPAPGAAKAFRVVGRDGRRVGYDYFLGRWDVDTTTDQVNWRLQPAAQTPANHLRVVVVQVALNGDREWVERYVETALDLDGIRGLLD